MQGLHLSFGNFKARLRRHWHGIGRLVVGDGNLRFPGPGLFLGHGDLSNGGRRRATFRRWCPSGCWGTCAGRSRTFILTHDFRLRTHRFQLVFSSFGWDIIKGFRTGWSRLWGRKLHNIHGLCVKILHWNRKSCMVIQGDSLKKPFAEKYVFFPGNKASMNKSNQGDCEPFSWTLRSGHSCKGRFQALAHSFGSLFLFKPGPFCGIRFQSQHSLDFWPCRSVGVDKSSCALLGGMSFWQWRLSNSAILSLTLASSSRISLRRRAFWPTPESKWQHSKV